jgi:hypothetical protein
VGGARALRVAPPGVEKYPSTMSLKALLCSLLIDVARISDGGLICRQLVFFSPLYCWYLNFSPLFFLFLIFGIGPFVEFLFVFNFILQS